jgi:hypothetical protein
VVPDTGIGVSLRIAADAKDVKRQSAGAVRRNGDLHPRQIKNKESQTPESLPLELPLALVSRRFASQCTGLSHSDVPILKSLEAKARIFIPE